MQIQPAVKKTTPSQDLRKAKLQKDPTCSKCGITKTVSDFPPVAVDYWCYGCRSEYATALYHRQRASLNPDELQRLKDARNAQQNASRAARLAAMTAEELAAYKAEINAGNSTRRYAARDAAYQAYGGYICACCKETERAFLSIDHINNDGAEHKRKCNLKTGEQMYRWLRRNNFPPGFQILCMNCQWGKRNNNGVCPHQVRCNDYPERE